MRVEYILDSLMCHHLRSQRMVHGLVSCAAVMSHYLHKLGSGTVVCTSGLELLMRQQGGGVHPSLLSDVSALEPESEDV